MYVVSSTRLHKFQDSPARPFIGEKRTARLSEEVGDLTREMVRQAVLDSAGTLAEGG